jgi:hypothetical protein
MRFTAPQCGQTTCDESAITILLLLPAWRYRADPIPRRCDTHIDAKPIRSATTHALRQFDMRRGLRRPAGFGAKCLAATLDYIFVSS